MLMAKPKRFWAEPTEPCTEPKAVIAAWRLVIAALAPAEVAMVAEEMPKVEAVAAPKLTLTDPLAPSLEI